MLARFLIPVALILIRLVSFDFYKMVKRKWNLYRYHSKMNKLQPQECVSRTRVVKYRWYSPRIIWLRLMKKLHKRTRRPIKRLKLRYRFKGKRNVVGRFLYITSLVVIPVVVICVFGFDAEWNRYL